MEQKIYAVELSMTIMVCADNPTHALIVAEENRREALSDCGLDASFADLIVSQDKLSGYGWYKEAIPYGGDGDTRLCDLLPETEPEKDTKTIDMFEV